MNANGIKAKIKGTTIENPVPIALIIGEYFLWLNPKDWKADWNPCNKWYPKENTPKR